MRYVNIDIICKIRLTNLMYYRLLLHDVVYHSISYRTIITSSVTLTQTRTRQNFEPDVNNCAVYILLDFSCKSEPIENYLELVSNYLMLFRTHRFSLQFSWLILSAILSFRK